MDILPQLGVSCELLHAEFIRNLSQENHTAVEQARLLLFKAAVENGLADEGDVLVKCKKCGVGKFVKEEHDCGGCVDSCFITSDKSHAT